MVLSIVHWNLDDAFDSALTLYQSESELEAKSFGRYDSEAMSIKHFFISRGISIQTVMEMFPGSIVPAVESDYVVWELLPQAHEYVFPPASLPGPLDWESQLKWQSLPMNQADMRRLATLLGMPILVYRHYEETGPTPSFLFRVEPE